MDPKALKAERAELIRQATALKPVNRVPNVSHLVTWKYFDAGYSLIEALTDYDKMESAIMECQERYNFDAHIEMGTRNPFLVSEAMGDPAYIYDADSDCIAAVDQVLYEGEEVTEYAHDNQRFIYEKVIPRRFPNFTLEKFQAALDERDRFNAYGARVAKRLAEEYGVPAFSQMMGAGIPIADLAIGYRGIKGFAIDYRRYHEKVVDALNYMHDTNFEFMMNMYRKMPEGTNKEYAFDFTILNLAQTVLSMDQWDKFFWPCLKEELDILQEKGKTCRMLFQGDGARFFDYLKDHQHGLIALAVENDDPLDVRKQLPDMAIMGGLKCTTLGYATPEECVEEAKRVVEGLDGRGILLSEDKMATYRNDAKRENLLAVCEYIQNKTF